MQIQSIPACSKLHKVLFCQSRRWGGSEAGFGQRRAYFSGHWCHPPSVYPVPQWWAFLSCCISIRLITSSHMFVIMFFRCCFLYRYLTSVHHRNLQWPNLYKKSKPRSAGCGIWCACWTGLLAGQKQVQSEQLLRFAIINWLGMI